MQIIIKGKQMDVPPRLRQHIERKVQRLSRLINADARIEVTVAEEQTRRSSRHASPGTRGICNPPSSAAASASG